MHNTVVKTMINFKFALGDVVRYHGDTYTIIGNGAYVYDNKRIMCRTYYDITDKIDIITHVYPHELDLVKACNISRSEWQKLTT